MTFDLSFLSNIDFKNPDNILFLAIVSLIVIIILVVFIIIILKTIKVARRATIRTFSGGSKSFPASPTKNINQLLPKSQQSSVVKGVVKEVSSGPQQKIMGGNSFKKPSEKDKQAEKNSKDSYEEKEKKDIAESLGKMKNMKSPLPEGDQNSVVKKINIGSTIKIVKSLENTESPDSIMAPRKERSLIAGSNKEETDLKTGSSDNAGSEKISIPGKEKESHESSKEKDTSIFEGKSEVSKKGLEHKLKADTNIWQASRDVGLSLSPVERSKLLKEVFSPALGTDISKADLKSGIRKLNQKLSGAKSPEEHAKIRKEIKFFKKIGGIK